MIPVATPATGFHLSGLLVAALLASVPTTPTDLPWRPYAPPSPEDTPADPELPAAQPWRAGLDAVHAASDADLSFDAIERALSGVALHRCEIARLWKYGESAGGRALLAIEISAGGHDRTGPAILVIPDLALDPRAGARLACRIVAELVQSDPTGKAARWIVVPTPLPDALDLPTIPSVPIVRRAAIDFPAEWDPWTSPDVGPYPLCLPETRALATALPALDGGALLMVLGPGERKRPGGLEAFAETCGWNVLHVDGEVFHLDDALDGLPSLSVGEPSVEPAAPGLLWVEVELTAGGAVGTGRLEAMLGGGRFVALASAAPGSDTFCALVSPGGGIRAELGALSPGESVRLRLLVAPEEGRNPVLSIAGRRTATRRTELTSR